MELFTERLILRPLAREDFAPLYKVLSDSDAMRHYPYTFDEARVTNWIERNLERERIFGFSLYAVTLRETGELIGDCGLTMQNINGVIKPEIGYHILKKLWRRGYAKEAALAWRDWAFSNTPFMALHSYMKKANIPSSATAKSLGMRFIEEYRDSEGELTAVYAITRDEWNKLKEDA